MLCDEQWPTDAADEVLRPARGSPEGGHPRGGGRYVARGRANETHALTTRQVEQELGTHASGTLARMRQTQRQRQRCRHGPPRSRQGYASNACSADKGEGMPAARSAARRGGRAARMHSKTRVWLRGGVTLRSCRRLRSSTTGRPRRGITSPSIAL